ncbi:MAG: anhydro-N-acetylmuramic acid kinase [Porticoccaceae bacterium]|jgi:anhydro-N-acetylmuramic acid kinase|nr:anhydro-N-acetylmuramic acid kinase [Porticoccaceae bacterium]MBT7167280.1 anhydro-N-acetylmuramic acid kinase [Porticoccaceae bacterium]
MKNIAAFIGLMSGTSIDSIDVVAVTFAHKNLNLLGSYSHPMPAKLRAQVLSLSEPGQDDVQLLAETDHCLGKLFAEASLALMTQLNLNSKDIVAIGSHGQTIRHQPPGIKPGFSLQIGNPNQIAAVTGCSVIADFRRKDMAYGGQGAPLVPAFHREIFHHPDKTRVIINIGGISNITILYPSGGCHGFDTGPGNILLDAWCQKYTNSNYDDEGQWGATGSYNDALLTQLKNHNFFSRTGPKSTGREDFNLDWLEQQTHLFDLTPADIQATLTLYTADTIAQSIADLAEPIDEIFVCGGGIFNLELIRRLNESLLQRTMPAIHSTARLGLEPNWVEACAFAWLAKQRIDMKPGNVPAVTGASRETILGCIYLP